MISEPDFPDVVSSLLDEFGQFARTPDDVGEVSPLDVQERLPFIRVYRAGTHGATNRHTDVGDYAVDVIHTGRNEARSLSVKIGSHLTECLEMRGGRVADIFIDSVTPISVPFTLPATDDTVRLWSAVYRIGARRQVRANASTLEGNTP